MEEIKLKMLEAERMKKEAEEQMLEA